MITKHEHMKARFTPLKETLVNDNGEFTHRCQGCDSASGFQYEDYCVEGCRVLVTECYLCVTFREQPITD